MPVKYYFIIAAFMIILGVIIFSAAVYLTKRKKIPESVLYVKFFKRFKLYYDFVLTRKMFRKVFQQVSDLAVYNYMEARVQAVRFFERALLSAVGIFVVGFIGFGDVVTGILLVAFSLVLMNNLILKKIDDVNSSCLRAISVYCSALISSYTSTRNIPDAVNIAECPSILQRNISKIYLIITANDGKERLRRFFLENQNRELRTLAVTCYIRKDTGDSTDKAQSPFVEAIRLIKGEVDAEALRQLKMRIMFKKLEYLPFAALFLYPPMTLILGKILPATTAVFSSTLGYASKLFLVVTVLVCYYVLSTINTSSVARTDDRLGPIASMLLVTRIRHFAKTLIPKSFRKRMHTQSVIDGCLSSKTLEYIALEKFVFGVVGIVLALILTTGVIVTSRTSLYDSITDITMTSTIKYTEKQKIAVLELQHKMMDGDVSPTNEELTKFFSKEYPKITETELTAHINRITSAVENYNKVSFKWYYCFIFIGAWYLGHQLSVWLLKLRSKLVESEAELDVLQLQTVIAILMDTSLDTLGILYWLAKSSDIHKSILSYCYNEYTMDPYYALNRLKQKSTVDEFSDMCNKLKTTVYHISLEEAFSDLITNRENTMATREAVQMESLRSKRLMASPIAKAPILVWMIVAFMLPIVVIAINTAVTTFSSLGQLGG